MKLKMPIHPPLPASGFADAMRRVPSLSKDEADEILLDVRESLVLKTSTVRHGDRTFVEVVLSAGPEFRRTITDHISVSVNR